MSIWWAFFFMLLGGVIVGAFMLLAWGMYKEGKREEQRRSGRYREERAR